ncbi:hypothetical protein SAMN02746066_03714 [Anaerosporobacter mobilis DSM 15930]|jgi:hypothetical protein|uniref:Uncharacterized protein n=1 Tax=Anaerosporobacter mobilis DSM 15930 TaxID=1120996 RepID=A0A1M7MAY2_9FIRM|nr:hypothetical protein [Anaerosporobacter mobilis]SHM87920.1 hypothetical protein SAMN02746066_03714 [Anaerosporobacter mobilis DSM 15930]
MTNYYDLPDYMEVEDIKKYFTEFIDTYGNSRTNVEYALDELIELSDRQWNTYEIIDETTKNNIVKYLFNIISLESETIMDRILLIIPRLGLKIIFDYIVKEKSKILNKNVIKEIEESVIEYGQHVENPYWDM